MEAIVKCQYSRDNDALILKRDAMLGEVYTMVHGETEVVTRCTRDYCKLSANNWLVSVIMVNGDVYQQDNVVFYELQRTIMQITDMAYAMDEDLAFAESVVNISIDCVDLI